MTPNEKLEYYRERLKAVFDKKKDLLESHAIMDDYVYNHVALQSTIETACNNYAVFTVFSKWLKKPLNDLTSGDIGDFIRELGKHKYERGGKKYNYSVHTIHMYRMILATFFAKKLEKHDLANMLYEKKPKKEEQDDRINKRERENLLTEEDVYTKIINAAENNRDRALISVFYECGARRGELLKCKIRHVDMKPKKGCYLQIPGGKTGKRKVLLVRSKPHLRAWIESHPQKIDGRPDPNAYLFVSTHPDKTVDEKSGNVVYSYHVMKENTVYRQLTTIAKRAGIEKPANPHQYRHASATNLAERGWSSYQLNTYHGWSNRGSTAAEYIHRLDVDTLVLEMNDIEPEEKKKHRKKTIKTCANCRNEIDIDASFCSFCGHSSVIGEYMSEDALEKDIQENENAIAYKAKMAEVDEKLFALNTLLEKLGMQNPFDGILPKKNNEEEKKE